MNTWQTWLGLCHAGLHVVYERNTEFQLRFNSSVQINLLMNMHSVTGNVTYYTSVTERKVTTLLGNLKY